MRAGRARRRPLTGAWIETSVSTSEPCQLAVAPSRGRGSKHVAHEALGALQPSPPHGGVDRNREEAYGRTAPKSRPLTGAWIETPKNARLIYLATVAPSRGRGSKHAELEHPVLVRVSPPHGGVDRNHCIKAKNS